jgi:UDP-3-O-[3-hydroxymyristoyl] N-acetylglucosamine deacetylase
VGTQRTLGRGFNAAGVGLHSGAAVSVWVEPAPDDHWIQVVRADRPRARPVRWHVDHVQGSHLTTVVGDGGWSVLTAEHLVAALVGMGVDNANIVVRGPEVPALDGSAAHWVDAIRDAGWVAGDALRKVVHLRSPVEVRQGGRRAAAAPSDRLELDVTVDFQHPAIGRQKLRVCPHSEGFLHELEAMKAAGRAHGGSFDNALVFGPDGPENPGGMRAPDEVVRHKTLDLVGDLALLGAPLAARVSSVRPGHGLTRALVIAIREVGMLSVEAPARGS